MYRRNTSVSGDFRYFYDHCGSKYVIIKMTSRQFHRWKLVLTDLIPGLWIYRGECPFCEVFLKAKIRAHLFKLFSMSFCVVVSTLLAKFFRPICVRQKILMRMNHARLLALHRRRKRMKKPRHPLCRYRFSLCIFHF